MNTDLIPSPDMLGLPAQPLLLIALMNLTLAIHWVFIGSAFGATFIVLSNATRYPHDAVRARMNRAILGYLPFMVSMGVTVGVAPLLFVQVLYGNFFYTANVLNAVWWLLLVPTIIANMYLFHIGKNHLQAGKTMGAILPAIMVVLFFAAAVILSSNAALTQAPMRWESAWQLRGAGLFLGSAAIPRALFATFGFLTIGAVFTAFLGRMGLMCDEDADQLAVRIGLRIAFVCAIVQVAAGVAVVLLLPPDQRGVLFRSAVTIIFGLLAVIGLVASALLLKKAQTPTVQPWLLRASAAYLLGLVALAFARDGLRRAALSDYFQLSAVPVNPQWGPFALFLGFAALATVAVVLLVRLARSQ